MPGKVWNSENIPKRPSEYLLSKWLGDDFDYGRIENTKHRNEISNIPASEAATNILKRQMQTYSTTKAVDSDTETSRTDGHTPIFIDAAFQVKYVVRNQILPTQDTII